MSMSPSPRWQFWIDRGGTFTDIVARRPDGRLDIPAIRPIARLGYFDYTVIDNVFEMRVPGSDGDARPGDR